MNAEQDFIATEVEGAGWPDHAEVLRRGLITLDELIANLRDEHYPPEDLIEWLEEQGS